MASHSIVTLNSSTATILNPAVNSGMDITIQNTSSSAYVYLGTDSTVTSSNFGFKLNPNQAFSVELGRDNAIWAISDSASSVAVMRINLESYNV